MRTDITYVRYPAFIPGIRTELPLKPVARHDTGFTFTYPWSFVLNLSLYPVTLRQPPDPVHSTMLPGIKQAKLNLAMTAEQIQAHRALIKIHRKSIT